MEHTIERQEIISLALEGLRHKGGITISAVDGSVPTNGYAFAPSKTTEERFSRRVTYGDIDRYLLAHEAMLAVEGNYLGVWQDTGIDDNGYTVKLATYLDVSRVLPDAREAQRQALDANQIAIWDIERAIEIRLDPIADALEASHREHPGMGTSGQGRKR